MNIRSFILVMLLCITGCQSLNQAIANLPVTAREVIGKVTGNDRTWTKQQIQQALQAKQLFDQKDSIINSASMLNTVQLTAQLKRATALLDRYKARDSIPAADRQKLAEVFSPLVDYAIRQELTNSNFQEIVIPPKTAVTLKLVTYCLDAGDPAPKLGEKQHLMPVTTLFDKELVPVYQALMTYSHSHPESHTEIQRILWSIRNYHIGSKPALALRDDDYALLNAAYPGAEQILRTHQRKNVITKTLEKEALKFFGDIGIDLMRGNASLAEANQQIGRVINTLEDLPVAIPIPNDNSNYTLLESGVAAEATHPKSLIRRSSLTLFNANDYSFFFQPADYALQSNRKTQRLGIGGIEVEKVEPLKEASQHYDPASDLPLDNVYLEEFVAGAGLVWKGARLAAKGLPVAGLIFKRRLGYWIASRKALTKPAASNERLQNTIDYLFRPGKVPGGTADAVRMERITGLPTEGKYHSTPAKQRIANLRNILKNESLDSKDQATAQMLIKDLQDALDGRLYP